MSLGKLLSSGKSLVGLSQSDSRYHLQKGALPKFESAKNPFASKAPAEPAEREPQLPKLSPAEVAPATPNNTQRLSTLGALIADREASVAASRNSHPVQPAEPAKALEPAKAPEPPAVVDSWLKKINPMVWFNRKPAEPKPAIPRFSKPHAPVQGELSLDNIKVMRNDLSEADVEVVPAKVRAPKVMAAPAPQAAAAAVMAIPDLPPATRAWEFIGEHLMGKH
jgi:hypothetical protein